MCQTTPLSYSIIPERWKNSTDGSCFGSIEDYEYQIPTGWYLNSTLSTGINWIKGGKTVALTPTATGDGKILYRALPCNSTSIYKGNINQVTINRPQPTFTLSPASLQVVCGTTPTQTFKVNASSNIYCSASYVWNLGTNNGWLYNGSAAPSTFTTTINSIDLTSANANILPSSVFVTPIYNGVSQPQLQSAVSFTPFTSDAVITGADYFCASTNSTFYINAGANNTVTWKFGANTAIVGTPTNSQITLNSPYAGTYILTAEIKNPCGQTVTKTKEIRIGTPKAYVVNSNYCPYDSVPCQVTATPNNNYLYFSLNADLGANYATEWQWEKISGNFYFYSSQTGNYSAISATGQNNTLYITGANPTDNPLQFRVRVKNSCGYGDWRTFIWNDGTTTPVTPPTPPTPPANYYTLSPNPAQYQTYVVIKDNNLLPPTPATSAELYNPISGQMISKVYFSNGQALFSGASIGNLITGNPYYVKVIYPNGSYETITLLKK